MASVYAMGEVRHLGRFNRGCMPALAAPMGVGIVAFARAARVVSKLLEDLHSGIAHG